MNRLSTFNKANELETGGTIARSRTQDLPGTQGPGLYFRSRLRPVGPVFPGLEHGGEPMSTS